MTGRYAAECDALFSALYKYFYLLTYLLIYVINPEDGPFL